MSHGVFIAMSSMWDQQGNNPEGSALDEALGEVVFDPATAPSPAHLGSHGDVVSAIDLALVSSTIALL